MRVLVLILASDTEPVYFEFQRIWRQYMKSTPNIDCYFYKANPTLDTEYKLEGDTLWIRMEESLDSVYEKTLKAFDYFANRSEKYDFLFRPNLSSFVVFDKYIQHCHTLPRERCVSAFIGVEGADIFPSGSGFTMSWDIVLELIRDRPVLQCQDDVTIGKWLHEKGIPIYPASRCDYTNNAGTPMFRGPNPFHYRVKNADRRLDVRIHTKLLRQFYLPIPSIFAIQR